MIAPAWFFPTALIQFFLLGSLLLFILWRLRPWAYEYRFRNKVFAWLLYAPYALSVIFVLTAVLDTYGTAFVRSQSLLFLLLIGILTLVVPAFAYHLCLYNDPRFDRAKKTEKILDFFNTVDTILLVLLAQPGVVAWTLERQGVPSFATTNLLGSLLFIILAAGLILYKMISLQKRVIETKAWWMILIEWLLLAAAYIPLLIL